MTFASSVRQDVCAHFVRQGVLKRAGQLVRPPCVAKESVRSAIDGASHLRSFRSWHSFVPRACPFGSGMRFDFKNAFRRDQTEI